MAGEMSWLGGSATGLRRDCHHVVAHLPTATSPTHRMEATTEQQPGNGTTGKSPSRTPSASAVPPPLTYTSISRTVHIFKPDVKAKTKLEAGSSKTLAPIRTRSPHTVPRVVLIMGWMNAPLRIVTKYAAPYALLFPTATIIVKLSQGVSFMRSRQSQLEALEKVADLVCEAEASNEARAALRQQVAELESNATQAGLTMDVDSQRTLSERAERGEDESKKLQTDKAHSGGMLIHSFSDGGAYNVSQLLRLLHNRKALTPLAHIMDSSPGKASPYSGSTAMSMSLAHRPWFRTIVRVSIYLYLYCIYAWRALLGQKTWSRVMRERLNSPDVWTWMPQADRSAASKATAKLPPRLYLYSKSDALIDYRAVEEHAQLAAKTVGLKAPLQLKELESKKDDRSSPIVALKRWDNVMHCDIGRSDFEGYWGSVRTFLEKAL